MARSETIYLQRAVRSAVREAVWLAACRHRQGPKRNILLFATRRGGSTWAMELIAANRGIRPLNQPFGTLSRNVTQAQMLEIPRFRDGQITSLSPSEGVAMASLVERIFDGRIVINAPTKLWQRDFVRTSDRLVLKITDAKPIIGWFSDTFDADIVVLTRHPIPQSLSCLRNGWTLTAEAHLQDERFVAANLSERAVALANDTLAGEDELLKFVVNWALENVAPVRGLASNPDWLHVRYEDCLSRPAEVLAEMAERLQLDDAERMQAKLHQPSGSSRRSTGSTRQAIRSGDAGAASTSWRETVDADTRRKADVVLDTFGIEPSLILP